MQQTGPLDPLQREALILYPRAVSAVIRYQRASVEFLHRRFRCGYGVAYRMLVLMEQAGLISKPRRSGTRIVHAPYPH
jgi:DNA segregation ATPase FtsK/SpoIIIE-like protein